jgi:D-alanyl-D-alanine carboxypeptidase
VSSNLDDLHPLFRLVAQGIIHDTNEKIAPSIIRPAVTFRSMTDQAAAKAAGLSKVSLGWHQMGLALDVAVITPDGMYVADGSDPRYTTFGTAAMVRGCVWGGSWNEPDYDHCEFHPNFTLTQYLAWLDSHKVVTA